MKNNTEIQQTSKQVCLKVNTDKNIKYT